MRIDISLSSIQVTFRDAMAAVSTPVSVITALRLGFPYVAEQ